MKIIFFYFALNNIQFNIFTFKLRHVTTEKSNCLKRGRYKALQSHKVKSIFERNHSTMTLVWLQLPFCVYWEPNPALTKNELVTLQMVSRRSLPHFCFTEAFWHISRTAFVNQPWAWPTRGDECYPERGEENRGDAGWALLRLRWWV